MGTRVLGRIQPAVQIGLIVVSPEGHTLSRDCNLVDLHTQPDALLSASPT